MEQQDKIYEINGGRYRLVYEFEADCCDDDAVAQECDNCALQDVCRNRSDLICEELVGKGEARHRRFEQVKDADDALDDGVLTEQRAYDDYQERSTKAGDRAEQLAWAMLVLLVGQLIGGTHYAEFYVMGAAAAAYMLLSALQSLWQSVAMWAVKQLIRREKSVPLYDYPSWVGFGAWTFYYLKFAAITAGAAYGIVRFLQVL